MCVGICGVWGAFVRAGKGVVSLWGGAASAGTELLARGQSGQGGVREVRAGSERSGTREADAEQASDEESSDGVTNTPCVKQGPGRQRRRVRCGQGRAKQGPGRPATKSSDGATNTPCVKQGS